MNNINNILQSFDFCVSNDHRIRAYELGKPWEEARVFEYSITEQIIKTYKGREEIESLWYEKKTLNSREMVLFWIAIPLSEALMYPIFIELLKNTLSS